jgi:hypothetical protein
MELTHEMQQAVVCVAPVFAVFLSLTIGTLNARDADLASRTFAARSDG